MKNVIHIPRIFVMMLVMQVLTLMSLWTAHTLPTAQAQVPDAGAQRIQIIDEQQKTNAKLDKLIEILSSGKLQVQSVIPDGHK